MPNKQEIEREINALAAQLAANEQSQDIFERITRRPIPIATARFHLTQVMVWAFLILVYAVIVYIEANGEVTRATLVVDILKTMLLPLVTLMIGHYFGTKSAE